MNTPGGGPPDAGSVRNGSGAWPDPGAPQDGRVDRTQRPAPALRVLNLNPAAIPGDMREARRWVVWNLETRHGKPTKVPYQAICPSMCASSTDATTWSPFDTAQAALVDGKADGLGFVLGDGYAGVDLDACRDPKTGAITAEATAIIHRLASYTEVSPSGTGVHILLRGRLPAGGRRRGHVEIYADGRYFTVTGHHLEAAPAALEERSAELVALHAGLFDTHGANGNDDRRVIQPAGSVAGDDAALLERAHRAHNGAKFAALWVGERTAYASSSEADLALCALLAFWTNRDAERVDRLFRRSGLFRDKWDERHGAQTYGRMTIDKAIAGCGEGYSGARPATISPRHEPMPGPGSTRETQGETACQTPPEPLMLSPADPLRSARAFVARAYRTDGLMALRHQGGVFYAYRPDVGAYHDLDEAAIRAELYLFLEDAYWRTEAKGQQPPTLKAFSPTKSKVENVLDALRAVCNLPASCAAPCWLQDDPGLDPYDIVACHNGLLHVPTRDVRPATPALFTLHGVDFAVDLDAPPPVHWLGFLNTLWPQDPASRDTLQEWIGYCLTPRTHLQKICLLVGPKRSGKGTIGRVMRRLLGERHVSGPTLAHISEQFGLSILVGKSVAIIADARISGRTDTGVLTERLLSISGEDTLSIPRKFLPDWTGKLTTRFLLMTNELPRIEDASGALASRFLVLTLHESFYGREDHALFDRFIPELPGILNWALEGWDRLYARGRFVQPSSAATLVQEFEDLGSPIGAFVRERCEIGQGHDVPKDRLFQAWKTWCAENGRERPGTSQTFGRNLRAVLPGLGESQPRVLGTRVRYYEGIRLREGDE
jgi:putative DNA primase/helicase